MDIKLILLVLMTVIKQINGNICVQLAHCSLVKGDIARESEKYGKDPAKFYKEAEDAVASFHKYIHVQDNSTLEECKKLHDACKEETGKMAVEGLGFPVKYQSLCDYRGFPRALFDCKSIKDWPKTVKDVMTNPVKTCWWDCLIIEDNNVTLTNGRVLNDRYPGPMPIGDEDIDSSLGTESRVKEGRSILKEISGFGDDSNDSKEWGYVDYCVENTWTSSTLVFREGDHLYYAALSCHGLTTSTANVGYITSTVRGPLIGGLPVNGSTSGYLVDWARTCPGSFIVGISLNLAPFQTYPGKQLLSYNILCANQDNFVSPRKGNLQGIPPVTPDSDEMLCDSGTAICSLQTKGAEHNGIKFLTNLRIGCCEVGPTYVNKRIPVTPPSTTPSPTDSKPGGMGEMYSMQISKFYYWDESEVYNRIITRYNQYYSPATIPDENVDITTQCKPGEIITGFTTRDPKSCFYQGRRIAEIEFQCGVPDGAKGGILDLYGRLRNGHTLQDHIVKHTQTSECLKGYTKFSLVYYKHPKRKYLVEAWGFRMTCGDGKVQEHILKAYPEQDLSKLMEDAREGDCKSTAGTHVCGFETKVTHDHVGAFEGVFYHTFICCP